MPYTRAWSLAAPLGTVQGKDIDLLFRQVKEDFEERLESALIVDMAADPWVLRDEVKGLFVGKKLLIGGAGFHSLDNDFDAANGRKLSADYLHAPLPIAPRNIIQQIEFLALRTGGTLLTGSLMRTQFTAAAVAPSVVASLNSMTVGKHIITLPAIAHTLDENYSYYLQIVGDAGASTWIYGVRVTYDSPDNGATV